MVMHTFNLSTLEALAGGSEFEARLIYKVSSRTARAIQRYPSSPVSYTHLRAHETEADLVCRLLLEKKK